MRIGLQGPNHPVTKERAQKRMLSALETKIPPPVLLLILSAIVWALPGTRYSLAQGATGASVLLLGLGLNAWPKRLFRNAATTVNPMHPERTSALLVSGLYRYSRNPMYLGYAVALLGWVICCGQPLGLLTVACFMGYITVFQIVPEERQLSALFPEEFAAYRRTVRRWL